MDNIKNVTTDSVKDLTGNNMLSTNNVLNVTEEDDVLDDVMTPTAFLDPRGSSPVRDYEVIRDEFKSFQP